MSTGNKGSYENNNRRCSQSLISDSGISDTGNIDDDGDNDTKNMPLLERLLQFKKTESEIFNKDTSEHEDDTDTISVLEFPFSDDEEVSVLQQPMQLDELILKLNKDEYQFSQEYLEIMDEIDAAKGPFSPPCSTCSLCSSCTTDTWDRLQITEDMLEIGPTPLDLETIKELNELKNEHSELINRLLSSVNTHDNDGILKERDTEEELTEIRAAFEKDDTGKLSEEGMSSKKESRKKKRTSHVEEFYKSKEWNTFSQTDDFFITPPDYDYYCDMRMQNGCFEKDEIPWSVKEKSRNKCAKWLKSQHY